MSRSVTIDLLVTLGGGQQLGISPVTTVHRTREVVPVVSAPITITISPVV